MPGMKLSPEMVRYLSWAAAVALGMVLAIIDFRYIGRWVVGCLLGVLIAGGMLLTVVSPFRFGGTSYYMEGVILAGGSALALVGYVIVRVSIFLRRYSGGNRG